MNRIANPFVRALLRSPIHTMISKRVMLITAYGRKTGKPYTTPVEYRWVDGEAEVRSLSNRTWWRNLGEGRPVGMLLQGRTFVGHARIVEWDDSSRDQRSPRIVLFRIRPVEANVDED